jgi:hypothetical protein
MLRADYKRARPKAGTADFEASSPSTKSALGIATTRMGGGVVLSVREDVTGYWSKALGFGFSEPVTGALIDRVVDFYRAERSRGAVIQIAPGATERLVADLRSTRIRTRRRDRQAGLLRRRRSCGPRCGRRP